MEEAPHPLGMGAAVEVVLHQGVGELQVEVVLLMVEGVVVHRKTQGLVFLMEYQCYFSQSGQLCNLQEWYHRIS